MTDRQRRYPPAVRISAVALAVTIGVDRAARQLNISRSTLYFWRDEDRAADHRRARRARLRGRTISCLGCGESLETTDTRQKFCTRQCGLRYRDRTDVPRNRQKHRFRKGRYRASGVRIDRLAVFERDGWRCGFCNRQINRRRKWPDPLSASLDHTLPISQGGDHTWANVRAAHLRCNYLAGHALLRVLRGAA